MSPSCIFGINITNVGFQWKPCLFFLFCDLDFMNFFNLHGGIHEYFGKKILKPKWYSWSAKKKIETTCWPSWALGPPLRPSGPAGSASGFNLFLFRTSWNHFGFKISCQNTRETTKKVKKNSWNQITKKKKDTVSI